MVDGGVKCIYNSLACWGFLLLMMKLLLLFFPFLCYKLYIPTQLTYLEKNMHVFVSFSLYASLVHLFVTPFLFLFSFRFLLPVLVSSLFFICFLFHTFLYRISSFFVSLSFFPIVLSVPISDFQLALHYVQVMLKNHTLNSNYLYIFFRILNERYRYGVSVRSNKK